MGYEDLNDHDGLRRDPCMAAGVGKADPLGFDRHCETDKGRALAGKSTLNRLELTNAKTAGAEVITGGPHKIRADFDAIETLLIRHVVSKLEADTDEIILDFDATDSLIHGDQEGGFYHGYYRYFCEFEYQTKRSWDHPRRMIGKAQVNPKGENPRFIVTNLPDGEDMRWRPGPLYREVYCARGDMEPERSGDRLPGGQPRG